MKDLYPDEDSTTLQDIYQVLTDVTDGLDKINETNRDILDQIKTLNTASAAAENWRSRIYLGVTIIVCTLVAYVIHHW